MRTLITFAALASILPAGPAMAQADPAVAAPGHTLYGDPSVPDISGLWMGSNPVAPGAHAQTPSEPGTETQWFPWPPRLTPVYRKLADERMAAMQAGRAGGVGLKCRPWGMPAMLSGTNYPDEIIQTPGVTSFMIFGTFPIMIWTDGRPHPKDLKLSYNGHSIGHWEGDTLHVDTVGILPDTAVEQSWLTPHSAKLHLETTIRKVNPDTLHVHITAFDEDAFTEPMVITNIMRRKRGPKWQVIDDISCFENNSSLATHQPAPQGFTQF